MKLPSINYLLSIAWTTLLRFPLPILASVLAAALGIVLVEQQTNLNNIFPIINILLCSALAIPTFYCIDVIAIKVNLNSTSRWVLHTVATLMLIMFYFTFPDSELTQNISLPYIRYAIYNISIHLIVSFAPYTFSNQTNGFWNYNKLLFLRIITAQLFAVVLYAGLALALLTLKLLFNIEIHEELFADIAIVIFSVFNTWYFLAGIPQSLEPLNSIQDYPKGLKIFSQYIMLPLLTLYLVILYAYTTKVVFETHLPKGIVAYLVICVAVIGIFTNLLLFPFAAEVGNHWIKKFSKAYYFLLAPLTVLLFVSIGIRVANYGITIPRYVIILTGAWLGMVCVYFVVGKTDIRAIPISLALMITLASFGPWGMFEVSQSSQVNRLEKIFISAGILQNGKIQPATNWKSILEIQNDSVIFPNENKLSDSLHNEVNSIVNYLEDHHGFATIRPWYAQNIDSLLIAENDTSAKWLRVSESEAYLKSAGLSGRYKYVGSNNNFYFNTSQDNESYHVKDYDWFVRFYLYPSAEQADEKSYDLGNQKLSIQMSNKDSVSLSVKYGSWNANFDLLPLLDSLNTAQKNLSSESISPKPVSILTENKSYTLKIEIEHLSSAEEKSKKNVNSISGVIYIGAKDEFIK